MKSGKGRGWLKRAFVLAVAGFVAVPSVPFYTPGFIKDRVAEIFGAGAAPVPVFQAKYDVALLSETLESRSVSTRGGLLDSWFIMMGHDQTLMRNEANREIVRAWFSQLDGVRKAPLREKIEAVNRLVGEKIKYLSDIKNFGYSDYWASPLETITRGKGDCEDVAILNYYALRYLGVPAERMYVAIVGSQASVLDHAVLCVNIREGDFPGVACDVFLKDFSDPARQKNFVIIDNAGCVGQVKTEDGPFFKLYYAMNELGIWTVKKNVEIFKDDLGLTEPAPPLEPPPVIIVLPEPVPPPL